MELIDIKGIGQNTLKLLKKLDINTVDELVHYYPFRYDFIKRTNMYEVSDNDKVIIDGIIENVPNIYYINKKLNKMTFRLNTGYRVVNITIFNRQFLKDRLKVGTVITVIGKYNTKLNMITASDIRFESIPDEGKIEPVYHITYGLTNKQLSFFIDMALEFADYNDYIPDYLVEKYNFINKKDSVFNIHKPNNINMLKESIKRLKYEELFIFMCKMNLLKQKNNEKGLKKEVDFEKVREFIGKLPFKLTDDQHNSVLDIYNDMISDKRMNRLLQGDVGSGKTIVAVIAIFMNYLAGYQSALMVPTEILATQHYNNIEKIFSDYNIKVALLTGNVKAKEKKEIHKKLKSSEIDVVIGTHALISDNVEFSNLGLVITDEQHRFGVNQRGNLKNKGINPDILYMSATPIPRTYALTLYGDMEISSIKTRPKDRKEVITYIKKESEIRDVLTMMLEELKKGHQIYVIAPLVLESEKMDLENVESLREKMNKAFGKYFNIGVVHGKLSNKEKDEVMEKFKNNEIQILISTTVIEVGVDVFNATMMVIFDSYRFGLSTLHQLRGRIGRNNLQSYCILISNNEIERLKILEQTSDGFKISEEDFKLRGSGDLFGVRQSGDMNFALADIKRDYNMLINAKEDSEEFIKKYINDKKYKYIFDYIEQSMILD